jgi:hypothetical protein
MQELAGDEGSVLDAFDASVPGREEGLDGSVDENGGRVN